MKIYDNKGKTFDSYTLVHDGQIYGLSENAMSPAGFNQYSHSLDAQYEPSQDETEISFEDCPEEVQRAITIRTNKS